MKTKEVLRELVECKDLRDTIDNRIHENAPHHMDEITRGLWMELQRREPLAWAAARVRLREHP